MLQESILLNILTKIGLFTLILLIYLLKLINIDYNIRTFAIILI
jgi:hypothetical protein